MIRRQRSVVVPHTGQSTRHLGETSCEDLQHDRRVSCRQRQFSPQPFSLRHMALPFAILDFRHTGHFGESGKRVRER
jgi:hypothetical protein